MEYVAGSKVNVYDITDKMASGEWHIGLQSLGEAPACHLYFQDEQQLAFVQDALCDFQPVRVPDWGIYPRLLIYSSRIDVSYAMAEIPSIVLDDTIEDLIIEDMEWDIPYLNEI